MTMIVENKQNKNGNNKIYFFFAFLFFKLRSTNNIKQNYNKKCNFYFLENIMCVSRK